MAGITGADLRQDVEQILACGQVVRFRFFTISGADTGYDDDIVATQSGVDLFTSGLIQPIRDTFGSQDAVLLQQGKILMNDSKLYVLGDVPTSGTWKVGLGSPTPSNEYSIIPIGNETWTLDTDVYKKLFIRVLPTGSLIGE